MACWGANFSGQLGDGSNVNRNVPARVVALTGSVVEVSAGSEHSCVVNADGTMRCWGANFSGQLGNGGNENRNEPFEVFGLRAVRPTVHVRIL